MLTVQEVFDKSANHLLTQKVAAKEHGDFCYYKTESGLTCAIGCLIEPEYYDERIEGVSVSSTKVQDILLKSGIDASSDKILRLLFKLQLMHDDYTPSSWRDNLKSLAKMYELEWNLEDTSC